MGLDMIGRMGTNMVRRLRQASHQCVVYDLDPKAVDALVQEGATGSTSLEDFAYQLKMPRAVWMMVPAAAVDQTLASLVPLLDPEDAVVDGGNTYYRDDIRRAAELKAKRNGIEYGIMASYAEGLSILRHADVGRRTRNVDAETAPLRDPESYPYDFNLSDITEVWRRGSVIASWLLDLSTDALLESPDLANFTGRVSDSGEGRWTIAAAIDESVPAPVLSAALYHRFSSRGEDDFADKVLSALRYQFGGHVEKAGGETAPAS